MIFRLCFPFAFKFLSIQGRQRRVTLYYCSNRSRLHFFFIFLKLITITKWHRYFDQKSCFVKSYQFLLQMFFLYFMQFSFYIIISKLSYNGICFRCLNPKIRTPRFFHTTLSRGIGSETSKSPGVGCYTTFLSRQVKVQRG